MNILGSYPPPLRRGERDDQLEGERAAPPRARRRARRASRSPPASWPRRKTARTATSASREERGDALDPGRDADGLVGPRGVDGGAHRGGEREQGEEDGDDEIPHAQYGPRLRRRSTPGARRRAPPRARRRARRTSRLARTRLYGRCSTTPSRASRCSIPAGTCVVIARYPLDVDDEREDVAIAEELLRARLASPASPRATVRDAKAGSPLLISHRTPRDSHDGRGSGIRRSLVVDDRPQRAMGARGCSSAGGPLSSPG